MFDIIAILTVCAFSQSNYNDDMSFWAFQGLVRVPGNFQHGPSTPAQDYHLGHPILVVILAMSKYNRPSALGSTVSSHLPLWTFPIHTG